MAILHRAVHWLHAYGRRYPQAWELYALFLNDPPMEWPSWCWCPLAGAYAVISQGSGRMLTLDESGDIGPLGALAAWRGTQGIYRFDLTLLHALTETPLSGDLPTETLTHLPEWCVYVETAVPGADLAGFWAYLEHDAQDGHRELRLVLDFQSMPRLGQLVIHLGGSLSQGIADAVRVARINALREGHGEMAPSLGDGGADEAAELYAGLVSLVLYLCSDEAEISARGPLPPKVVQGKKRPILPAAKAPVIHETGARLGAALRAARERYAASDESTGATVRPHVRRAHWHHYWTGPRDSPERRVVLRWLSPILVGFDEVPCEATVRPVREPRPT